MAKRFLLKQESGFTLIEVMIAIIVFSIGLLAVALMQLKAINSNSQAQRLTEGAVQAQQLIEQIKQQPFASFAIGTTPSNNGIYTINQVVAAPPVTSVLTSANALWISVTVSWTGPAGNLRSIPVAFIKTISEETSYDTP